MKEDNHYNLKEQIQILMQIKVYTAAKEKVIKDRYKNVKYKKLQW